LKAYRKQEEKGLNSYGWVDRNAGIVSIPIEEAIRKVVADGVPRWAPSNRMTSPLELQRARAQSGGEDE
jgi:hypothetical protein